MIRSMRWSVAGLSSLIAFSPVAAPADIPWPQVMARLQTANDRASRRPGSEPRRYLVVCTVYFTPLESGFRAERGFDVTLTTKPGLHGRKYPRDFLRLVRREGFGRLREPVQGCAYLRYSGENRYEFARHVVGRGGEILVPKMSAAARPFQPVLAPGRTLELIGADIRENFGHRHWKIADTGNNLHRWQLDLYWGEDEPLGPGRRLARPRGTNFEYAISEVRLP